MRGKRAQNVVTDLFLSITIFTLVIGVSFLYWTFIQDHVREGAKSYEMESLVLRVSDTLLSYEGFPQDWEDDPLGVISLGLSFGNMTLDKDKIDSMLGMDYEEVRSLLGLESYHFQFLIYGTDYSTLRQFGRVDEDNRSISIRRVRIYEGEPVFADVVIYG